MKQYKIPPVSNMTEDNFGELQRATKGNVPYRLKSLYSYNIFDNPDYMMSQKIERRIKRYTGALIEREKSNMNLGGQ
jgi:hypothetical protein